MFNVGDMCGPVIGFSVSGVFTEGTELAVEVLRLVFFALASFWICCALALARRFLNQT